jgi:hypothetical protein
MIASAVRKTKASGSEPVAHLASVTDTMHALLVKRADELVGCTENSPEEAELAALVDVIDSYEAQRGRTAKYQAVKAEGNNGP